MVLFGCWLTTEMWNADENSLCLCLSERRFAMLRCLGYTRLISQPDPLRTNQFHGILLFKPFFGRFTCLIFCCCFCCCYCCCYFVITNRSRCFTRNYTNLMYILFVMNYVKCSLCLFVEAHILVRPTADSNRDWVGIGIYWAMISYIICAFMKTF